MGTCVTITLFGEGKGDESIVVNRAFEEIRRVDELLSSFSTDSDVTRINRHAGNKAVHVSALVLDVIRAARM